MKKLINKINPKTKDAQTVDDFANLIKETGCDLTKEQYKKAVSHITGDELSLDELDNVAGGAFIILPPTGNS